jgi:N-carbamoyl-L-amino-acid hydrolase
MSALRVNGTRLMERIVALAEVSPIPGGGNCRLALTDDDKAGRDLVITWMKDLGLEISIDVVGNIVGVWNVGNGAPVMTGSHIDTVRTGGKYDGNLGVLAGLEVIETLQQAGVTPQRPFAVAVFTDEEGARFAPDMLGSLVFVGGLSVEEALDITAIDGPRLGDELTRIGYAGNTPCPQTPPHSFVELHIEQGPLLEANGVRFGAVTGVQGISWQELTITGQSNHAGTTPMRLRKDPVVVVAEVAKYLHDLAMRYGGDQVCTVGKIDIHPSLINVVAAKATMTLDVRNTDEMILRKAEQEITEFIAEIALREGVTTSTRTLARFEPVQFDQRVIDIVHHHASNLGHSVQLMPSGAGHDAQMLARVCPTAMIFTQSKDGLSHNAAEYTSPEDLEEGSNILLHTMLTLAETDFA